MQRKNTLSKDFIFTLLLVMGAKLIGFSQIKASDWTSVSSKNSKTSIQTTENLLLNKLPEKYSTWNISVSSIMSKTTNAKEKNIEQEIVLPDPNGNFETFIVKKSNVIAQEVAHLYTIQTFIGYNKEQPSTMVSFDISDDGLHAAVYKAKETYFIEPLYKTNAQTVIAYYKKDNNSGNLNCKTTGTRSSQLIDNVARKSLTPSTKSTFRIAIAASGEYSQQFGGSPISTTAVLNSLASGLNIMNPIYLRDLGVQLTLVSNAALVYPDPATDPFDPDETELLSDSVHDACVSALTNNGFDLGHAVLWTNIGGLAGLGVVCSTDGDKGAAYSGNDESFTTLWVDFASHEVGHQFGSEHNFTSQECAQSADDYRFEPGEGSSIMAYANVCGPPVQFSAGSDPYFHYASIKQMQEYILNEASCVVEDSNGNTANPTSNAQSDITIPKETPFILVGSGTDANDPIGNLTYDWVQYDGAGPAVTGSPDCTSTNAALFRYRGPTTQNSRSFPQEADVIAGNNDQEWEKLPCAARTLNFSLTVRDNNTSFGRIGEDRTVVTVANTGPFAVTAPNGGEIYAGNSVQTVTWSVNGTNAHCANVDILISTDGGNTYTVIADATTNDGTESITLPDVNTTTARILVSCDVVGDFKSASTFYDVSNANFAIDTTLSASDIESLGINIYPNPATSELFIKLNKQEDYTYRLVDLRGVSILKGSFNNSTRIETENLQTGVYFLQLNQVSSKETFVKKMIIQN